jgi:hypothetical protein
MQFLMEEVPPKALRPLQLTIDDVVRDVSVCWQNLQMIHPKHSPGPLIEQDPN